MREGGREGGEREREPTLARKPFFWEMHSSREAACWAPQYFFLCPARCLPTAPPQPFILLSPTIYMNDLLQDSGSWIVQFRDIHKDNRKKVNDQHSNISPRLFCFVNPLNMQIRLIKITSSKLTKVFVLLCVVSYLSAGVAVWIR